MQQKATNAASKDKLMAASYCALTIFPTSMALTIHVMSIVATTPLTTKIGWHIQTNGVTEFGCLIFKNIYFQWNNGQNL